MNRIATTTTSIKTTCAYCGVGCGIIAEVDEQTRTISVKGDPDHPANFGRLCSKGSALAETLSTQERLTHPRINGSDVSWDVATSTIAEKLKATIAQHGADSVMFYVSGQLLTEDYYVANKLIKGFIGTNNIDSNSRLCMSTAVAGYKRAFGSDTVPVSYQDMDNSELFIITGSNMAWCHPVLFQRLKAAQEKDGKKVVVIDPRVTDTCSIADLHLPIKPGTDTILFNGLFAYLNANGYANADYLAQCDNYDATLDAANAYNNSEDVARLCDISVTAVEKFYQLFADTKKVITFYSMGVNQSSSGTDKVNSIINCHALTGRIGRKGMGPFSITGQPNAMGGREVGALANLLAAHYDLNNAEDRQEVAEFWQSPSAISPHAGLTATQVAQAITEGKIKAIWIMATNPVVSLTEANSFAKALTACELVIVSECSMQNDTLNYADIVLPAQSWSEKSGTLTNSERCISRQKSLLSPYKEAKPDWWIISQVAQKMGFDGFDYDSEYAIFKEHAQLSAYKNNGKRSFNLSAVQEISREDYNNFPPQRWPMLNDEHDIPQKTGHDFFSTGKTYTDTQKVQLIPIFPQAPKSQLSPEFPLILNTGRIRDQWHTMTRTGLVSRLNQHLPEPFVLIHPQNAEQQHINDNDLVSVSSTLAAITVRAKVSTDQRQGEVFCPMHWSDNFSNNARVGQLITSHIDPFSKQPEFKYSAVNIQPITTTWHGVCLITNNTFTPDIFTQDGLKYWVKAKHDHLQKIIMAGQDAFNLTAFKTALNLPKGTEEIHYCDTDKPENIRMALIYQGQLIATLFIAQQPQDLPKTTWLKSCFNMDLNNKDNRNNRKWLLAGAPAEGDFDVGDIICSCFSVGEKTINNAIKMHSLTSPQAIGKCLKAGTNCGSCVPELNKILATHHG